MLVRTACGLHAALVAPLVPELSICKVLAEDYAGKDAIQLDLDNF